MTVVREALHISAHVAAGFFTGVAARIAEYLLCFVLPPQLGLSLLRT
jgi:hypothetical protein